MANKLTIDSTSLDLAEAIGTPAWVVAVLNSSSAVPVNTFVNLDGDFVFDGNTYEVGGRIKGAYLKTPVSQLDANTYTFDPFTGDSAISATVWNSQDTGATWSFYVTDATFKVLKVLCTSVSVPDSLSVTTLPDLISLTNRPSFLRNFVNYVTALDFYTFKQSLSDMAQAATTVVRGALKINVNGADTAVATIDPTFAALNQTKYTAGYASIAAALTDIGAVTRTELKTTSAANITANTTLTANIASTIEGNGGFVFSNGAVLTIANGAAFSAPSDKQIFSGNGKVYFPDSLPDHFRPEWWAGANASDYSDAFDAILEAYGGGLESCNILLTAGRTYPCSRSFEPDIPFCLEAYGATASRPCATMTFPANKHGIIVHHVSTKTGVNNGRGAVYSQIRKIGVVGLNTYAQSHLLNITTDFTDPLNPIIRATKTSGFDFINANNIVQGYTMTLRSGDGHTYVINSLDSPTQITFKKPRLFALAAYGSNKIVSASDSNDFALTGEWVGQNLKIDGANYEIATVDVSTAFGVNTQVITLTTPFLGTNLIGGYTQTVSGFNAGTDELTVTGTYLTTGMAVKVISQGTLPTGLTDGTVYYAIKTGTDTIKLASSYANALANTAIDLTGSSSGGHLLQLQFAVDNTMELQSVGTVNGVSAMANIFNGITLKANAIVEDCQVWNFNGHLISLDSTTGQSAIFGTAPNNNLSTVARNSLNFGRGAGVFAHGINSNQCHITQNDASNNLGGGYFEAGFLGNTYMSNHSSFNGFAAFWGEGASNYSQFFNEYTEGGQCSARTDQYMMVYGGDHGAGFDAMVAGGYIRQSQGRTETRDLYARNNPLNSTAYAAVKMGRFDERNVILGYGAAENPYNLGNGGSMDSVRQFSWQLAYDPVTKSFKWFFGGNYSTDIDKWTRQEFDAGDKAGHVWLKNTGILPRTVSQASTATLTINAELTDVAILSAQAANLTIAAPTGSAYDGQKLIMRIKDNGTSRTITLNAIFRPIGATVPASTTIGKTLYLTAYYNTADTKWDILDVRQEA